MRKLDWIFPTQFSNIIVVTVVYTVSVFYTTANTAAAQDVAVLAPSLVPYVSEASSPSAVISEELENSIRFHGLVAAWHAERGITSAITEMCTTPAYLQIMALGPRMIPLIINQIRSEGDNPDHWFFALHYLTKGFDPVPDDDKGDMAKMAQAWLEWAEREGYAG